MKRKRFTEPFSKIVGAVSPIEWGSNGKPNRFTIFTEWGEDFFVVNKSQESILKNYANKMVEAYGQVYKTSDGENFLNLKSINLLGSPSSTPAAVQPHVNDWEELAEAV